MKQACAEEEARILLEAQKYQYVHNPMQSALPTHTLEETANFEKTTIMVRSQ